MVEEVCAKPSLAALRRLNLDKDGQDKPVNNPIAAWMAAAKMSTSKNALLRLPASRFVLRGVATEAGMLNHPPAAAENRSVAVRLRQLRRSEASAKSRSAHQRIVP
jgi:hypothetical protein